MISAYCGSPASRQAATSCRSSWSWPMENGVSRSTPGSTPKSVAAAPLRSSTSPDESTTITPSDMVSITADSLFRSPDRSPIMLVSEVAIRLKAATSLPVSPLDSALIRWSRSPASMRPIPSVTSRIDRDDLRPERQATTADAATAVAPTRARTALTGPMPLWKAATPTHVSSRKPQTNTMHQNRSLELFIPRTGSHAPEW